MDSSMIPVFYTGSHHLVPSYICRCLLKISQHVLRFDAWILSKSSTWETKAQPPRPDGHVTIGTLSVHGVDTHGQSWEMFFAISIVPRILGSGQYRWEREQRFGLCVTLRETSELNFTKGGKNKRIKTRIQERRSRTRWGKSQHLCFMSPDIAGAIGAGCLRVVVSASAIHAPHALEAT